jgi:tetratricopeptide (TPR) repeat protein
MIVSGMLRVITDTGVITDTEEKGEWLDYYRHFVLTVRPGIMTEFTEAAILKARNDDFDLALEILATLQGLFPSSPVVTLNRALVLEERAFLLERQNKPETEEAFRAAEAAYTEAAARYPAFTPVHFNAGFFYLGQKDFRRARECFALYVESGNDAEKKEKAESIVKDIDKNGLDDESFSNAYTLIRQGKEEEAMRHIRDFIERYPSVWNGWFILGWALRRLGRWQDGAAAFEKAVELGGGGSDTRNELAICLMESGDLKSARRELETALRDDPENVKIISNLGVLAAKDGRPEEAAGFFRIVLELDPDDEIAKNYLNLNA